MHRYVISLGFSLATLLVGCSGQVASPDPSEGNGSQAVGKSKDGATAGPGNEEGTASTGDEAPPTGGTTAPGDKGTPPATGGTTAPGNGDKPPPTTGDPGDKGTLPPSTGPSCVTITFGGCFSVADAKLIANTKCAYMTLTDFTIGASCGEGNAVDTTATCCDTATVPPPDPGCGDTTKPPPAAPGTVPAK